MTFPVEKYKLILVQQSAGDISVDTPVTNCVLEPESVRPSTSDLDSFTSKPGTSTCYLNAFAATTKGRKGFVPSRRSDHTSSVP